MVDRHLTSDKPQWLRRPSEWELAALYAGGIAWRLDESGSATRCHVTLTAPREHEAQRLQLRSDDAPLETVVLPHLDGVWCSSAEHDAEWTSVQLRGGKSARIVLCAATSSRAAGECDVATLAAAIATIVFVDGGKPSRRSLRRMMLAELRRVPPDAQTLANIDLALSNGVDANMTGDDGFSALVTAAWHGNVDAVQLLLRHGASVAPAAARSAAGALHAAASRGSAEATEALLLAGANPLDVDARGSTPLHYACAFAHSPGEHARCAALICDASLEVDVVSARDADGETALDVALIIEHEELATLLRGYGAVPTWERDRS